MASLRCCCGAPCRESAACRNLWLALIRNPLQTTVADLFLLYLHYESDMIVPLAIQAGACDAWVVCAVSPRSQPGAAMAPTVISPVQLMTSELFRVHILRQSPFKPSLRRPWEDNSVYVGHGAPRVCCPELAYHVCVCASRPPGWRC